MKHIVTLLVLLFVVASAANGEEPNQEKPAAAPFDVRLFSHLIDHDIGIPRPGCTLAQMGIPARTVDGQLLDHDGTPLKDVLVALVEPIGYASHCYYDNFALTDADGRFQVAGFLRKTRIVFRRDNGWSLVVNLKPAQPTMKVNWPTAAVVNVTIPAKIAVAGETLTIRTQRFHVGMSAMSQKVEVARDGPTVFRAMVPGSYVVLKEKSVSIDGRKMARSVEIGSFDADEGASIDVDFGTSGTASVSSIVKPVVPNSYVVIEREKLHYEDVTAAVDLFRTADDGFFLSRKLPPGVYVAKVMVHTAQPAFGAGFGNAVPMLRSWRFRIDADSDPIRLNELPAPQSPVSDVVAVLERAGQSGGRFRPRPDVDRLKSLDDRAGAEQELLRLLSDPMCPYNWRRFIPEILAEMTDSSVVIDGLLRAAKNPVAARERGAVLRAFSKATTAIDRIEQPLAAYSKDANHITRGVATRTLGDLAVAAPEAAERIAALLEQRMNDADETVRYTAADYLGRISQARSLPVVLAHTNDLHGPTAVMSGYAAWKITGNPEQAFDAMNGVLRRDGLLGKWQAAYFLKDIAAKHELPQSSRQLLQSLAGSFGKPPFRTSYEYEVSRAGKIAQQTLDSL